MHHAGEFWIEHGPKKIAYGVEKPMRKFLPPLVIALGLILLIGAAWYGWHIGSATGAPAVADVVPAALAGSTRTELTTGAEAVAQIQSLHLSDLVLVDGIIAVYGSQQAVVWVAETDSISMAAALLASMETNIAQGGTQFTAASVLNFGGRDVYEVEGLGQLHFYFQSSEKVIWLSADQGVAEQALIELMKFYP